MASTKFHFTIKEYFESPLCSHYGNGIIHVDDNCVKGVEFVIYEDAFGQSSICLNYEDDVRGYAKRYSHLDIDEKIKNIIDDIESDVYDEF